MQSPADPAPLLVLLEKQSPQSTVAASDLHANELASMRFAVVNEQGLAVSELIVNRRATELFGSALERAEGEARTEYVRFDAQNNIVLIAAIDHDEHALTEFNPPLMLMPRELAADSPVTSKSAMRVLDSENRSKLREAGKATRTMKYASDQRIRTPLGEFIARRIEVEFTAELRLAQATERTTMYIVPDLGLVAEQTSETVKILGAFGKTKTRTIVRIE